MRASFRSHIRSPSLTPASTTNAFIIVFSTSHLLSLTDSIILCFLPCPFHSCRPFVPSRVYGIFRLTSVNISGKVPKVYPIDYSFLYIFHTLPYSIYSHSMLSHHHFRYVFGNTSLFVFPFVSFAVPVNITSVQFILRLF